MTTLTITKHPKLSKVLRKCFDEFQKVGHKILSVGQKDGRCYWTTSEYADLFEWLVKVADPEITNFLDELENNSFLCDEIIRTIDEHLLIYPQETKLSLIGVECRYEVTELIKDFLRKTKQL